MPEYEVEVEITLKVTIENVEAANEDDASKDAVEQVRERYERIIRSEDLTQIDTIESVWVDEYLEEDSENAESSRTAND